MKPEHLVFVIVLYLPQSALLITQKKNTFGALLYYYFSPLLASRKLLSYSRLKVWFVCSNEANCDLYNLCLN